MRMKNIYIFLVVMLCVLTTTVLGYSTETYTIEIGNGYEAKEGEGFVIFQALESNDNIVVQEINQAVNSDKLTDVQIRAISSEITNQYKDIYDANVELLEKKEVNVNNLVITRMTYKTHLLGTDIYQELNVFISGNRIYDIIFTSTSKDRFSDNEKNTILNSFKTLNVEENSNETISTEKFSWELLVIFVCIIFIVAFIIVKTTKKAKKTQTEKQSKKV